MPTESGCARVGGCWFIQDDKDAFKDALQEELHKSSKWELCSSIVMCRTKSRTNQGWSELTKWGSCRGCRVKIGGDMDSKVVASTSPGALIHQHWCLVHHCIIMVHQVLSKLYSILLAGGCSEIFEVKRVPLDNTASVYIRRYQWVHMYRDGGTRKGGSCSGMCVLQTACTLSNLVRFEVLHFIGSNFLGNGRCLPVLLEIILCLFWFKHWLGFRI